LINRVICFFMTVTTIYKNVLFCLLKKNTIIKSFSLMQFWEKTKIIFWVKLINRLFCVFITVFAICKNILFCLSKKKLQFLRVFLKCNFEKKNILELNWKTDFLWGFLQVFYCFYQQFVRKFNFLGKKYNSWDVLIF
jgi:hypothetical protein